jgi:hypothetical protein
VYVVIPRAVKPAPLPFPLSLLRKAGFKQDRVQQGQFKARTMFRATGFKQDRRKQSTPCKTYLCNPYSGLSAFHSVFHSAFHCYNRSTVILAVPSYRAANSKNKRLELIGTVIGTVG